MGHVLDSLLFCLRCFVGRSVCTWLPNTLQSVLVVLHLTALWRLERLYKAFNIPGSPEEKKSERLIVARRLPDVSNYRDVLRKLDRKYHDKVKRIVVDLQDIAHYDIFMSQASSDFFRTDELSGIISWTSKV